MYIGAHLDSMREINFRHLHELSKIKSGNSVLLDNVLFSATQLPYRTMRSY